VSIKFKVLKKSLVLPLLSRSFGIGKIEDIKTTIIHKKRIATDSQIKKII